MSKFIRANQRKRRTVSYIPYSKRQKRTAKKGK